ncbi:threonine aldolase family protein [Saccharothrix coeruleofusca]|uniref:Aromatic amino acid beta-eliminating lyase/threonine aldolase domain-containing protein n=1 Tax=Saccharothrix coeruleofusca TaxID=33919 RepID=A0A918AMT0_9PSEU|nr:beta-eliminating lyase-related protein [Saccharothrix coeruleofusca]GGP53331.1 hypothetical protein GCM10010185_26840 [Saccharothrix coeruleofusca]
MAEIRRSLVAHAPLRRDPHKILSRLLERVPPGTRPDAPVAELEERIAGLLGKPAALFFPTGTMAQQTALRVHADRRGRPTFAAHPQCHLALWENNGYSAVHGLRFQPVGDHNGLITLDDLHEVREPLSALLLELPQREIGGLLPPWDDLVAQTGWAAERGIARHVDGARLWESQPYYDRPFSEIAALFDTVYVSLYKGLEGVRGAVLAGEQDVIDEASVWRRRLGGDIPDAWPLAVAALMGLDEVLPRMAEFRDHAVALAAAINADGFARTVPEVPCTPMFHLLLPMSRQEAEAAARELVEERGIHLFTRAQSTTDPRVSKVEVTVGVNGMGFDPQELVELLRALR